MSISPYKSSLKRDIWNLPNALTMARVAMIPAVILLLRDGRPQMCFWAAMTYSLATVTDALDGWIARRQNLVSVLGKFLDPLADKLIVIAMLVQLVEMGWAPAWVVIVIIARELAVTTLRTIAMGQGLVISAQQGGKDKTAVQMVALLLLIIHYRFDINLLVFEASIDFYTVGMWLLYFSLLLALISAGEYVKLFANAVEAKSAGALPGEAEP